MEQIAGFKTITYRFKLHCGHEEWLKNTKAIYNEVLQFYYAVLLQEPELESLTNMQLMRQLELLSIGSKTERQTKYLVTFGKVPLYFRRAAINDAIRLFRIFSSGKEQGAHQTGSFKASPVYYKGMYKEFTPESVMLKLFTGERWNWVTCELDACGRTFDGTEKFLSPILKIGNKQTMLHVPVQKPVQDVRTVKERLEAKETICAVSFPSNDCIRTSTERPEALDKACFVLAGIDGNSLLQAVETAVEMNNNRDYGIPVPDYVDENVSDKVVKLIQSYTGVVNKMVWRKEM